MTDRRPRGRRPAGRRGLAGLLLAGAAVALLAPPAATQPAQPPPSLVPFEATTTLQAERLRGLRPDVARRILRGPPGGEIGLAVVGYPLPAGGDRSQVALFVEIDGASFLDANQSQIAQIEIYAYALTPAGSVGGYLAEAFTLDVARHGEAIWSGGLRFLGALELPAGEYQLRVMVHNSRSLAHGLAFTRLKVPSAIAGPPAVLAPLLPSPRLQDSWLAVLGRGGGLAGAYPFAHHGRALVPAARPVLMSDRKGSAFLIADRLPRGRIGGRLELLGEPEEPGSEPPVVGRAEVTVEAVGAAAPGDSLAVDFVAPASPPGRYELRLVLDTAAGTITTPTVEVLLADAAPQDRELTWSDLRALVEPAVEPPEPATPDPAGFGLTATPARPGRGLRRLATRYRQALIGSLEPGVARPAALAELELAALGRRSEDPLGRLRTAELLVAAELGRERPELLLPLISIHDELFHLYRRRHLFSLVVHTRRMLESLAEFHAELGGSADVAADVLATVGGYMQELRSPGVSRRLFGRALEHQPQNPAALLGLANSYEKYGDYPQAVARLETLVELQPELDEARLRLALNSGRTGDRTRFRQLLAELVAGSRPGWVGAVACQELARSLLEAGALDEAAAVLEQAIEEMPERQALRILLAHVYDRQGMLRRSWDSLEQATATRRADLSSERLTYDNWKNGPLEKAKLALAEQAQRLRQELTQALSAHREAPG